MIVIYLLLVLLALIVGFFTTLRGQYTRPDVVAWLREVRSITRNCMPLEQEFCLRSRYVQAKLLFEANLMKKRISLSISLALDRLCVRSEAAKTPAV